MKKFLIIGIEPDANKSSGSSPPPVITAAELSKQIEATQQQFAARGDRADVCGVKLDGSAAAKIIDQLARETYDCVMIGGGLREDEAIEVLEQVIDAVRRHAPSAVIAFLKLPKDAIAAASRVLSDNFSPNGPVRP